MPSLMAASASLTIRPTWLARVLRAVGLLPSGALDLPAGADFLEDHPAAASYEVATSQSAYAAFPWVYACCQAIATDLSGLPLVAVRGQGKRATVLDEHPALDLLGSPSTRVTGVLFRRQWTIDLVLSGNCWCVIAVAGQTPTALLRLAPQRVQPLPMSDGQIGRIEYSMMGGRRRLEWGEFLHVSLPSWEDDPSRLYGTGAIRPLHEDLTADLAASKNAAKSSQIGRPSGVLSPAEKDGGLWSQAQIDLIRAQYDKKLSTSGLLILGGAAKYEQLGWSPRDMEYGTLRSFIREGVLATLDVPPSRVGLPNANYATAEAQSRRYWEGLQGRAALFDDTFTRLASMFPGSSDVTIRHDFSGVEVLQEARSRRLARVGVWVGLGVPLSAAAAYEGFDDAPAAEAATEPPTEPPTPGEYARGDRRGGVSRAARPSVAQIEGELEAIEVELQASITAHLRGQARRVVERYRAAIAAERTPTADELCPEQFEARLLTAALAGGLRRIAKSSREEALEALEAPAELRGVERSVGSLVLLVGRLVGRLVTFIGGTTRARVQAVIDASQDSDPPLKPAEIEEVLIAEPAFSEERATRIAGSSATAAASTGAQEGAVDVAATGVVVLKKWRTRQDAKVRPSLEFPGPANHRVLDDVEIDHMGEFEYLHWHGFGPGLFGDASMDVNCRCKIIMRRAPAK